MCKGGEMIRNLPLYHNKFIAGKFDNLGWETFQCLLYHRNSILLPLHSALVVSEYTSRP